MLGKKKFCCLAYRKSLPGSCQVSQTEKTWMDGWLTWRIVAGLAMSGCGLVTCEYDLTGDY